MGIELQRALAVLDQVVRNGSFEERTNLKLSVTEVLLSLQSFRGRDLKELLTKDREHYVFMIKTQSGLRKVSKVIEPENQSYFLIIPEDHNESGQSQKGDFPSGETSESTV